MIRARFQANHDDYRPIKWPPPGPYWCSGYAADESYAVLIAYVRDEDQLREFWPEASGIETSEANKIEYYDRFPRPDWWPEGKEVA
jgi:hypothetical protein